MSGCDHVALYGERPPARVGACRRAPPAGFTLVELGLVIGLLGLIALFAGSYLVNMAGLGYDNLRVEGTVRDACIIIAAATDWKNADTNAYGSGVSAPAHLWPHDGTAGAGASGSPGDISIEELLSHPTSSLTTGILLQTLPEKRYQRCGNATCGDYALTGRERSTGAETADAEDAEDLILKLYLNDEWQAEHIASRLPVTVVNENTPSTGDPWYELVVQVQGLTGEVMPRPLCGP